MVAPLLSATVGLGVNFYAITFSKVPRLYIEYVLLVY